MNKPLSMLLTRPDFWRYYVFYGGQEQQDQHPERFAGLEESYLDQFSELDHDEDDWEPERSSGLEPSLVAKFAEFGQGAPVRFEFPLGDGGKLTLEVNLQVWMKSLTLALAGDRREYELGWWDGAHQVPFAFRWQELEQMHRHWQDHADRLPVKPVEAFLLLACFVGTARDEKDQLFARRKELRDAYDSLDVFKPTDLVTLSEQTLVVPTDCRWMHVEDLGWTFDGENGCYSFRNKADPGDEDDDLGDDHGSFPIQRFEAILQGL